LIMLAVKASIALTVFALGLAARLDDVLFVFRRPGLLLRSLLAMNVVMPVVAAALAIAFDLHPAVKIALVALGVSPVPPVLPRKQRKAGGRGSYAIGLLVAAGLLAIIVVPVALEVIKAVFGVPVHLSPWVIAQLVFMTVLAPLGSGLIVGYLAPAFAARMARPLSLVSMVVLVVAALPILIAVAPAMLSLIGNGTLAAFAAFTVVALTVGHLLGGPHPTDRTVLALSTATRHPGVALAIATANFPEQKLVVPALLLYAIMAALVSVPYMKWRRRQEPTEPVDRAMPATPQQAVQKRM